MKMKKSIYLGALILCITNLISLGNNELFFVLAIITSVVLCVFISKLDISSRSPNAYYELGFTFTLLSIICSMLVTAYMGMEESGLLLILGNFGIALLTSAWGMILKVSTNESTIEDKIRTYNESLVELAESMRVVGDDVTSASKKISEQLIEQVTYINRNIKKYENQVDSHLEEVQNKLEENQRRVNDLTEKAKVDFSNLSNDYRNLVNSKKRVLESLSNFEQKFTNEIQNNYEQGKIIEGKIRDIKSILDSEELNSSIISEIDESIKIISNEVKKIEQEISETNQEIRKTHKLSQSELKNIHQSIKRLKVSVKKDPEISSHNNGMDLDNNKSENKVGFFKRFFA